MNSIKERIVETPAGPTRVWEKGRGKKLGYLAGLNGLPKWSPFLDKLAETRRVIVPSLPGYPGGPSSEPLDTQLDWVLAARDALVAAGLDGADLIGASVGGALAAEVAALWPKSVRKLVLIAPFGLFDSETPIADVFAQRPGQTTVLLSEKPTDYAGYLSVPKEGDAGEWEVQTLRAHIAAASLIWPLGDTRLSKRLMRIMAPTLILWGHNDHVIPLSYARRFAEGIGAGTKVKIVRKAGHTLEFDEPKAAARTIDSFLSS
ncbi:alpha/beta hydrolase [Methylocella sp. CPCC 101449]|jgi:pimeloyl-ACP methyl ester carboxylesterase|uniref:alpha/beta fold hydrolase n=1 Tax=Methylocella sp. CPCC 101449 TaxID=2987531 RepID=UPI00289252B2|nr:alpha/beta hydrolase [Methylocella sp. CPCC 101449]MDT2021843.1 alpha/beta hydrolase [Methylocella sp. CPCC 101449]HEV2571932.1 alpha/beta hydrolase [Beijerinckiaceae bacterium]